MGGIVSKWPLYNEGAWWVQDPSATLPAIALFNALQSRGDNAEDLHVVDLCSAPGGKTAQLCSMGFGKIDAIEISQARSKSLKQNLKRLGMHDMYNLTVEDGRIWKPPDPTSTIDGILVDAPCTASGVGSRRPDVLRKSFDDLTELLSIQRELLAHSADNILQLGGVMVYATCSLLKQEGEDQVTWLLSRGTSDETSNKALREKPASLKTLPFSPGEIPGFDKCIDNNGWLRVVPGVLPGSLKFCDGFFVAKLMKMS
jgi:16S rRNA (cytosine967-C5)-methyltransferase